MLESTNWDKNEIKISPRSYELDGHLDKFPVVLLDPLSEIVQNHLNFGLNWWKSQNGSYLKSIDVVSWKQLRSKLIVCDTQKFMKAAVAVPVQQPMMRWT